MLWFCYCVESSRIISVALVLEEHHCVPKCCVPVLPFILESSECDLRILIVVRDPSESTNIELLYLPDWPQNLIQHGSRVLTAVVEPLLWKVFPVWKYIFTSESYKLKPAVWVLE